jgi:large subunit ribosomal protein L10
MPSEAKLEAVAAIKDKLTGSDGVILADYRGLSVKEMQEFRRTIGESGAEVKVFKNTLTEIAIRELAMPSMDEFLEGPTCFIFVPSDPSAPAKAMVKFAKEHEALEIKGGFLDNDIVDVAAVKAIAALPSREELIAKFMSVAMNPVRGFMAQATAPATALTRTLKAVADQKEAA